MKKWLLIFFSIIVFIYLYYPIILPPFQPFATYSMVPDSEGEYLTTLRMYQGQGWYSSFSYVYPPGKFIERAILFYLIGPTFSVVGLPMLATTRVIFPVLLFVLALAFSNVILSSEYQLRDRAKFIVSYLLAVGSVFLYLALFRSAQEIHVIIASFLLVLFVSNQLDHYRKYLLGVLWGLAFLFRIDAGILLSVAFLVSQLPEIIKVRTQYIREYSTVLAGIGTVWLPVFGIITLHGSLKNFFYDTLVLGLIVQPKFMSLPIPDNQFGLFYLSTLLFLVGGSIAMFLYAHTRLQGAKQLAVQTTSLVCVLSYVAVLGRSDEPHLWYGLIWLPFISLFSLLKLPTLFRQKQVFSKKSLGYTLVMGVVLYLFGLHILDFKSTMLFLTEITGIFVLLHFSVFKKISVNHILIACLSASLLVFHSVNFLKLKFVIPHPPVRSAFEYNWLQNDPGEVGGLVIEPQSKVVIDQIRADIPADETYLFIFPKNVFLNEYFHLSNPTRYTLLSLERSKYTEREVIDQLIQTNTQYFLVFPESAKLRAGPVWHWIMDNTQTINTYSFGSESADLRKKMTNEDGEDSVLWIEKY